MEVLIKRIKSLKVRNFRGISTEVELSLVNRNGKISSMLILGDNGTGKSSLCDAFEFCLRGKISRRGNAGAKTRREAQNLINRGTPYVEIEMEDGKVYGRGSGQVGQGNVKLKGEDFAPGFSMCPTVLSRPDIEVFWKIDPSERMRFFFDYFRDTVKHTGYVALEIERTQFDMQKSLIAMLQGQLRLSRLTQIPASSIPTRGKEEFVRWRSKRFRQHPASPRLKKAAGAIPLSRSVRQALDELEQSIDVVSRYARHIESQKRLAGARGDSLPIISSELSSVLNEIASRVSEDFAEIAKLEHIDSIQMAPSKDGVGLEIDCVLATGDHVNPVQILSESSLDLLALLVMLGVADVCAVRGQTKFLVMDDVWQSVDSVHRNSILDYLFGERFSKWQLIVTVHDRLWARLIQEKARRNSFPLKVVEVTQWSAALGPMISDANISTIDQLSSLIQTAQPEPLCAYTGRSLEELSDRLTVALGVAVSRIPGDRYTLENLWPPLYSKINKYELDQAIKYAAKSVDDVYILRNTYGAHYSQWAESMSRAEVLHFANSVKELWERTHCEVCSAPLSRFKVKGKDLVGWPCSHEK
ncbi:AAA family ATPase [Streptomyces sp. NPDC050528]|uniref:AAA family ATPase n=1 Tax=unclassified Streptomyces TaxID=2593676 RepID=UPI00379E6D98